MEHLGACELDRMIKLHCENLADPYAHKAKIWDERVEDWAQFNWKKNLQYGKAMERVRITADYLREQGVLGPATDVIDIGCGPGRFVVEFASTAHKAVGIDISPRTIEYAKLFAQEIGRDNTEFFAYDFHELNIRSTGLEGAFDLAFSSITPALQGINGLEKFMALSRAWCYISKFVHGNNELHERIAKEVFNRPVYKQWDGKHFYTTFNILYLQGYNPLTNYYRQEKESSRQADREAAAIYARTVLPEAEQTDVNIGKIYDWIMVHADAEGKIHEKSVFTYGWLLWDKRTKGKPRRFDWK
jgi:SAM-dependent methyltransferase